MTRLPFVSFVIPTLNAERYLQGCLQSIKKQYYPQGRVEVLVVDGGSEDKTVKIAKIFGAKILENPYRDAESGKSIGIQKAKGEIIALLDADNELVENNWLQKMTQPLIDNPKIFGVESPWYLRREDSLINQYITLLKIADPLARCFHPKMKVEDKGDYLVYYLKLGQTPVVGANGFLWRKKFIKLIDKYSPKFEEVNYISLMIKHGYLVYARVKGVGVYHYYCSSLKDYFRKRVKIGRKFMYRKQKGQETWLDFNKKTSFFSAILYNLSFLGPLQEAIREYRKTKNIAWFYHPFISFLTIVIYFYIFLEFKLKEFFKYGVFKYGA